MKKCLLIPILTCLLLFTYLPALHTQTYPVQLDSLELFDSARQRPLPVMLYLPATKTAIKQQPLVIMNHGYNANQPGASKLYSYLTRALAARGYFVASIQHELPTDDLIPSTGIPQLVRRPFWERGAANILFVLNELKKTYPGLDYGHTILTGHSNGGDMCMLFAQLYPQLIGR
jgi:predicted dienelactone hydrolase